MNVLKTIEMGECIICELCLNEAVIKMKMVYLKFERRKCVFLLQKNLKAIEPIKSVLACVSLNVV